jgi:hypothetical protein
MPVGIMEAFDLCLMSFSILSSFWGGDSEHSLYSGTGGWGICGGGVLGGAGAGGCAAGSDPAVGRGTGVWNSTGHDAGDPGLFAAKDPDCLFVPEWLLLWANAADGVANRAVGIPTGEAV